MYMDFLGGGVPEMVIKGWSVIRLQVVFHQGFHCAAAITDAALYHLIAEGDKPGLTPEDFQASVATLRSIATSLGLECVQLRERTVEEGIVAEFLLRQKLESEDFMEIR